MTKLTTTCVVAAAAIVLTMPMTAVRAQETQSLGSVRLTRAVTANGEPLTPGTYTLRLTPEAPKMAVGLPEGESRWVEFVQGGQVRGREVATVLTPEAMKKISEGAPPAPGTARVQMLKGNDYLRVWVFRGGTHYLVHLAVN